MATIFAKEKRGNPVTIRLTEKQRELIQTLIEMNFASNQTDLIHAALDLYVTRILDELSQFSQLKSRDPEKLQHIAQRRAQLLQLQQILQSPNPLTID